ncbi:MAG: hypothetical protein EHM58_15985 [Ignavibacteriae bacterium]|nr:MAG: hypothetical protein EHM58_15985 [Ignavibacteriota bacterium]
MKIEEKVYKTGYSLKAGENYIELIGHKKGGYDFNAFSIKNEKNKKIINELRKRFFEFAKREKCIIQSEDSERDMPQSNFLIDCGFKIKYSKICFVKNLINHTFPYDDIFQYRSINDTGIEKFFEVFRASCADPIRTLSGFKRYIKRMIKEYNCGDDIDNWKSVFLKERPVGIIMPFKILTVMAPKFTTRRKVGTLLNIALLPKERGKGYGRIIHSRGLMILKDMDLKTYLGSTNTDNYAMLKVFKINKCRKELIQNFYHIK